MTNNSAEVAIRDLPAIRMAGMAANFVSVMSPNANAFEVLPALWGRVSLIIEKVLREDSASASKSWMVGAIGEPEPTGQINESLDGLLSYFAGVRLEGIGDQKVEELVAAGLQVREYAAGRFAVCEHVGPLESLGETTAWFYQTWLPAEGLGERYAHHYEIYDERFDISSPSSVVMICAPVR